jgi:putative membrane protein
MPVRFIMSIASIFMLSAALAQVASTLTDPQTAQIAYTAGEIEIEAAKQALSKSANKDVRAFAAEIVRDHTAVNKHVLDIVHKVKLTPEDSDISRALAEQAANKRAELSKLNGAEFDKAYIANEVAYQITVNGALEITLAPSVNSPELKSLLQTGLKIFQGHHQRAKDVADTLQSGDGGK